jgi:hypothetical protein
MALIMLMPGVLIHLAHSHGFNHVNAVNAWSLIHLAHSHGFNHVNAGDPRMNVFSPSEQICFWT